MVISFRGIFVVGGGGGWGEEATWKDLFFEEFFMGEENFHEEGARFPSII